MKTLSLYYRRALLTALGSLALASVSYSAERYQIDRVHSSLAFTVGHFGFSRVLGQFRDFSGQFSYDPSDLAATQVSVTVDLASVFTNDDKRDNHLRSADFFDVRRFPTAEFIATQVEPMGDDRALITGDLTLLGVTKPVQLEATINRVAPHPLPRYEGRRVVGLSIRGELQRSEFGMEYALPALSDDIQLWFEIEGLEIQAAP